MPGSEGMERMKEVMAAFRNDPPREIAGMQVDAASATTSPTPPFTPGGEPEPLEGPTGDLVLLDFATDGNYIAIRPSGTEPKVKLYMFTYEPPEQLANLESTKADLQDRLDAMEAALREFAGV